LHRLYPGLLDAIPSVHDHVKVEFDAKQGLIHAHSVELIAILGVPVSLKKAQLCLREGDDRSVAQILIGCPFAGHHKRVLEGNLVFGLKDEHLVRKGLCDSYHFWVDIAYNFYFVIEGHVFLEGVLPV
jgi:hypothetical protein